MIRAWATGNAGSSDCEAQLSLLCAAVFFAKIRCSSDCSFCSNSLSSLYQVESLAGGQKARGGTPRRERPVPWFSQSLRVSGPGSGIPVSKHRDWGEIGRHSRFMLRRVTPASVCQRCGPNRGSAISSSEKQRTLSSTSALTCCG